LSLIPLTPFSQPFGKLRTGPAPGNLRLLGVGDDARGDLGRWRAKIVCVGALGDQPHSKGTPLRRTARLSLLQ